MATAISLVNLEYKHAFFPTIDVKGFGSKHVSIIFFKLQKIVFGTINLISRVIFRGIFERVSLVPLNQGSKFAIRIRFIRWKYFI